MLELGTTHGGITPQDLTATLATLTAYREHVARVTHDTAFTEPESSVLLPFVQTSPRAVSPAHLRYVVVIGIGGSNLGAMAITDALFGKDDALRARTPKMLFLDTVSASALRAVESVLLRSATQEEFIVFVISKSGTTTESIANAEALYASLVVAFPDVITRFTAITDEGSALWQRAGDTGMARFALPAKVGGRYSVLSNVGLVPLAYAGVDIDGLMEGARRAVRDCTAPGETNPAAVSAAYTYLHARNGVHILNTFLFDPDLESLGKWYRQLLAESIGKSHKVGVTPVVSIGSTDLHSMAQLYLAGPRDKFTHILTRPAPEDDAATPATSPFSGLVDHVEHKPFATIMSAIVGGVTEAYAEAQLPFFTMHLVDRSAAALGYFMQMRMMETMFLAHLFGVDAFNQPAVEMYKKGTRARLAV